jgi:hypothetical protein
MNEQTYFCADPAEDRIVGLHLSLINDSKLTLQQRALVILCTSQSPGWQVSQPKLAQMTGLGRDQLQREIRALIDRGYCKRDRLNNPTSGHIGWRYQFRSKPPSTENQVMVHIDQLVVVNQTNRFHIAADVIDRGLVNKRELESIKQVASQLPQDRAQLILDELVGSLRSRGRNPPNARGIRNAELYFAALNRGEEFKYAAAERELREARLRAAKFNQSSPHVSNEKGVPCPPELAQKIAQIVGAKSVK